MKRKAIKFKLIEQYEDKKAKTLSEPYRHLDAMRIHHPHLSEARIALAWHKDLKPDKDGLMVLGKCKKVADLDKELHPFDFVILLNEEMWEELSSEQRDGLLDHELSHAGVVLVDGEPKRDDRGRVVYRYRKHDLEEFRDVVKRHGLYKGDLEAFAPACIEQKHTPLFGDEAVAGSIGEAS